MDVEIADVPRCGLTTRCNCIDTRHNGCLIGRFAFFSFFSTHSLTLYNFSKWVSKNPAKYTGRWGWVRRITLFNIPRPRSHYIMSLRHRFQFITQHATQIVGVYMGTLFHTQPLVSEQRNHTNYVCRLMWLGLFGTICFIVDYYFLASFFIYYAI